MRELDHCGVVCFSSHPQKAPVASVDENQFLLGAQVDFTPLPSTDSVTRNAHPVSAEVSLSYRFIKVFRKIWFSARIPWFVRGSHGSPV